MKPAQSLYHHYRRYRTLQTDRIRELPIAILMPHSACNCRCVMCDIWKDNKNLKQLTEKDVKGLMTAFKKFGTKLVVMSGGEALLNSNFFTLCELIGKEKVKISLLSTGLLLEKHASSLLKWVHDIVVSVDGDEKIHDAIRNVPGAFAKLKKGVLQLHDLNPDYKITARTVIHRLNFRNWPSIIQCALDMGLKQISFLPADVSSHAFNRQQVWDRNRQEEILLTEEDLPELQQVIQSVISDFPTLFKDGFIAESPQKLQQIHDYYAAFYGLNPYPYKRCNAPWVSTVIEADGTVRSCFFHGALGNIRNGSLPEIMNSREAIDFRKSLDVNINPTCMKCVCHLNLPPGADPF